MKKNWIVLLFLFLFAVLTPRAFAQDTLSDEILTQAKAQADLFLELKNALGLDWLDKYNTYLQNPSVNPEPSWTLSVQDLINNGYLSAGFPSDFSLSPSGAEVVISRPVSTQSVRDAITIYLPSATISGNTVSLLVQRPAQWIAWQDALNGKVSRDGSGDPDILPGANLDFGSGSKIEFVSSDGKILGVDSLTYKGKELENRFVNVSGDSMTGPLYINGSVVWHAGNDGSGSGLDADLLDGKHGSDFIQQPIRLSPGTNLNNVTTPGMYYCPLDVEAKQIANVPVGYAFSLLVEKHAGVKQTFTQYLTNSPTIWTRNYYNGTWGPWIKAAQVVEKQRYVSGYWYVGARDRVEGGRRGGSLAGGNHQRRYYYAPNRNASGAKTWYTFDELMTIGSVRAIPNTVGMENLISATFGIEANGVWESAATIQVFERNPSTGQVTTLINKYVSRYYVSGSCTIRKGYEYGIVATLHSVCGESYDDGYRAHAWITSYVYKYYEVQ